MSKLRKRWHSQEQRQERQALLIGPIKSFFSASGAFAFLCVIVLSFTIMLNGMANGSIAASDNGEEENPSPKRVEFPSDKELSAPPFPTLGGLQLWQDRAYYAGWRVQRHVWTGHYRLLDPDNLRRSWGEETEVLGKFEKIKADPAIKPRGEHLVILLHGWGRTAGMFGDMRDALERAGYDVHAFTYPSTRASLADHAAALEHLIGNLQGTERVSFVTHSLGGIVLRKMLAGDPAFPNEVELHRAVLIAAPNQGAAIAEALVEFSPFHWIGGPVARDLTDKDLRKLPPPSIPFLVIAGALGDGEGWNPLIEGDDDGVVALAETYLEGAEGHLQVEEIHTFIANHPNSISATLNFLSPAP